MVPVCAGAPAGASAANSAATALAARRRRERFTGSSILHPGALERLGAQLAVDHAGRVVALRQVAGLDQPVLQPSELVQVDRHGGIDAGLRVGGLVEHELGPLVLGLDVGDLAGDAQLLV